MESLTLAQRKLSRNELMTGVGGSFLVHVLAVVVAFISTWAMPHKAIKPPFCTVNLVSLQDPGTGASEKKGNPSAAEEPRVADSARPQAKTSGKSRAVLPVKRLHLDEAARKEDAPIRKIEPKEAPRFDQTPQSMAAIEKNLDKLIKKPKPVERTSPPAEKAPESKARAAAPEASASPPDKAGAGASDAARGAPSGAPEGGSRGAAQGSTAGSPEGSTAVSALVNLYGDRVRQKIEGEWRLINDQSISGLKTVVEVQIRKNGEVINVQVVRASGNSMFDEAAVRAVRKAAPLPAVPEIIAQSSTKLVLTFLPGSVS